MELSMVRYRDDHDSEYIYFWIEKFNNEMVSEVFETEEDALNWYKNISARVDSELATWNIRKV